MPKPEKRRLYTEAEKDLLITHNAILARYSPFNVVSPERFKEMLRDK